MADFNKPNGTSTRTNFATEIRDAIASCITLEPVSDTNKPNNSKRYNASTHKFENWTGSAWSDLPIDLSRVHYAGIAGGTVNALTLTISAIANPLSSNFSTGQIIAFYGVGNNTGNPTIQIDGGSVENIYLSDSTTPVPIGVMPTTWTVLIRASGAWVLLNPEWSPEYQSVSAAGASQAAAAALTTGPDRIVNISGGTGGVRLPTPFIGMKFQIYNSTGSSVNVYPSSGHTIGTLAADAPVVLTTLKGGLFTGFATTGWLPFLTN